MKREYEIEFAKFAAKEFKKHTPKLQKKIKDICQSTLKNTPEKGKKLVGDLSGLYSLRITRKDRIVYEIDNKNKIVFILSVKTHYGD